MAEIADPTIAYSDPEFIELWESLDIQNQLQDIYNLTFTSESAHRTVKQTYLTLISAYKNKLNKFYIDDSPEDEQILYGSLKKLVKLEEKLNVMETSEDAFKITKKFNKIIADIAGIENLEEKLNSHWESLERNIREVLKSLAEYLQAYSDATIQIEQKFRDGANEYNEKRFFVVKNAEEIVVNKMTERFRNNRIRIIQDLRKSLQEEHDKHLKKQIEQTKNSYGTRKAAKESLSKLKSKMSKLRVRYYSEPVDKTKDLEVLQEEIYRNNQEISLLTCQLKSLERCSQGMEPINSMRVEASNFTTPIFDSSPVEHAGKHERSARVNLEDVVKRLKVPQMNFDIVE